TKANGVFSGINEAGSNQDRSPQPVRDRNVLDFSGLLGSPEKSLSVMVRDGVNKGVQPPARRFPIQGRAPVRPERGHAAAPGAQPSTGRRGRRSSPAPSSPPAGAPDTFG